MRGGIGFRHPQGQRGPVHQVGPAEVVDHLGDRAVGPRVPFVVRQLQVGHHGAVFVPPPRLPQVHACKSSHQGSPAPATRPDSCAYSFPALRHPPASMTSENDRDQAQKCLRAAEVRPEQAERPNVFKLSLLSQAAHRRRRRVPQPRRATAPGRLGARRDPRRWQISDRRYLSEGSMALLDTPPTDPKGIATRALLWHDPNNSLTRPR